MIFSMFYWFMLKFVKSSGIFGWFGFLSRSAVLGHLCVLIYIYIYTLGWFGFINGSAGL